MCKLLFRGKRIDNQEWEEGYYVCLNGTEHRIYDGFAETDCGDFYPDWWKVDPATVGQFTGLTDKNDKRIFEGDIVRCKHFYEDYDGTFENRRIRRAYGKAFDEDAGKYIYFRNYTVRMYNGAWELRNGSDGHRININYILNHDIEVIGNIHDNPELMEG